MAGIGDYEEGKPFSLKSGNKPSGFKMMGSTTPSPIASPTLQVDNDATKVNGANSESTEDAEVNVTETAADNITENIVEPPKVNKAKTIASKIGGTLVGAFTSGLDAVYGSGKVIPGSKVKFHDPKKKKEEKTGEDKVKDLLAE